MVSHGEMIRSGYDQRLEYDADEPAMLIQGLLKDATDVPYPSLPWRLGVIRRGPPNGETINPRQARQQLTDMETAMGGRPG